MRLVQLDQELFLYKLDADQYKFYCKSRNALKKMWIAQGVPYWIRFLLTYKKSFENYISKHDLLSHFICAHYERYFPDFVYIRIHKHFIESTIDNVDAFFENIFQNLRDFHKTFLRTSDIFFSSAETLNYFNSAYLNGDKCKNDIKREVLSLLTIMYSGFVDGFLNLFKKWQKESDLSKVKEKNIDLTIYYWKPEKHWECQKYSPSCFERYLASCWTEALPRLLLTCDVHNIFTSHAEHEKCSCQYKDEESLLGLLKDKYTLGKPASLNSVHIYKPETTMCKDHGKCYIKIQHSKECREPFICIGNNSSCTKTCETIIKSRRKEEVSNFWKKCIVEVFNCKKGKKRNVSTQIESIETQIETFCPSNENKRKITLDLEEFFYCNFNPIFKNSYTQQKRKEEYRNKLRKKLQERYDYDCQDPDELQDMYDEAQRSWLSELCIENCKEMFARNFETCDFDKYLHNVKKSLTTVAVGTSSVVFGRVVLPTGKRSSLKTDCTPEVQVSTSTQKKPKKKLVSTDTTSESTKVKAISKSATGTKCVTTPEIKHEEDKNVSNTGASSKEVESKNNLECKISLNISSKDIISSKTIQHNSDLNNQGNSDLSNQICLIEASDGIESCNENKSNLSSQETELNFNDVKNESEKTIEVSKEERIEMNLEDLGSSNQSKNKITEETTNLNGEDKNKFTEETTNLNEDNDKITEETTNLNDGDKNKITEGTTELSGSQDKGEITCPKVELSDQVQSIVDAKSSVNQGPSDIDDELDTFLGFVANGEENTCDSIVATSNDTIVNDMSDHNIMADSDVACKPSIKNAALDKVTIEKQSIKKNKLKTCAYCLKIEDTIKSFKRCSKCKADNLPNQYYYCSRECQIADWEKSHRELHLKAQDLMEGFVEVQGIVSPNNNIQCQHIIHHPKGFCEKADMALYNEVVSLASRLPTHYVTMP